MEVQKLDVVKYNYLHAQFTGGSYVHKKVSRVGLVIKVKKNEIAVIDEQCVGSKWADLTFLKREEVLDIVFRGNIDDLYNKHQRGELKELFNCEEYAACFGLIGFIKAEKLKQLIREHKKQKQLLIINLAHQQSLVDEYIVRQTRISRGSGIVNCQRLNPVGNYYEDNKVLSGRALADLDLCKLRVADEVELLTSTNKVARCFAIEPILEWIPRIEDKFNERKATSKIRSENFQRTIEQLFKQRNMFPTGIPPRIRKIAKEILKEETDKAADLRIKVYNIIEEIVDLHDTVKERLTEKLKEIARSKK